jgi:hypothetical protein
MLRTQDPKAGERRGVIATYVDNVQISGALVARDTYAREIATGTITGSMEVEYMFPRF